MKRSYGDSIARVIKHLVEQKGYDKVISASSTIGKDVMPRVAGMIDVQPITDVIEINGDKFKRPIYAGNAIATVSSSDKTKLITVRSTNFNKVEPGDDHDAGFGAQDFLEEDAEGAHCRVDRGGLLVGSLVA